MNANDASEQTEIDKAPLTRQGSRALDLGPTAQPLVAGLYAWAITVAPIGYVRHAPAGSVMFTTLALAALGRGTISEVLLRGKTPLLPGKIDQNRSLTLVTFALASTSAWLFDTDGLGPVRMSAARGIAGVLGWIVFAFVCAAPTVEPAPDPAPGVAVARIEAGPRARNIVMSGDAIFVGIAALLAGVLQIIGWNVATPERAIFVRLVTIGSAIAILSATSAVLSSRHGAREPAGANKKRRPSSRRVPLGWLVALAVLLAGGVLYAFLPAD